MYAAKFRLRRTAVVFKIGGKDLGKPIGNITKSVTGVIDNLGRETSPRSRSGAARENALVGIKFSKYHKIPKCSDNKLTTKWEPEYLKSLENSKNSEEFITVLWQEGLSKSKSPLVRLGAILQ